MTIRWTEEMLAALSRLRGLGMPLFLCVETIGVSYPTCVRKARAMDLAGRLNRGGQTGPEALEVKPRARLILDQVRAAERTRVTAVKKPHA